MIENTEYFITTLFNAHDVWLCLNFVPFSAVLTVPPPLAPSCTLCFGGGMGCTYYVTYIRMHVHVWCCWCESLAAYFASNLTKHSLFGLNLHQQQTLLSFGNSTTNVAVKTFFYLFMFFFVLADPHGSMRKHTHSYTSDKAQRCRILMYLKEFSFNLMGILKTTKNCLKRQYN